MKKILILGGTGFVGRILTENLLKEGIAPVLFNRGMRNAGIFPELKRITGDRNSDDIKQIADDSWDVVIDFSCMQPDNLEEITNLLKGKAGRYIFVSTASVYPMEDPAFWQSPVKEDAPTLPCTDEQRRSLDVMISYGQKKAECERVLLATDWLDSIIFRPALIYGRYDPTDRFYYWLYKVHTQNKILLPDGGRDKCTNTYSEDFAALIRAATDVTQHNSIYNASTHEMVSLRRYIDIASEHSGKSPQLVNASMEFLEENSITPWADLPVWLGGINLALDNSKAVKDFNIKFRSFSESVKECIDYYTSLSWPVPRYGISAEKENELLDKLQAG